MISSPALWVRRSLGTPLSQVLLGVLVINAILIFRSNVWKPIMIKGVDVRESLVASSTGLIRGGSERYSDEIVKQTLRLAKQGLPPSTTTKPSSTPQYSIQLQNAFKPMAVSGKGLYNHSMTLIYLTCPPPIMYK